MLPYHLAQLAAFCSQHPVGPKVLFVPSHQIGYNLTNALSLSGFHWANFKATTPLAYARSIAEPELRARSLLPISEDIDQLLVEDLLRSILKSDPEHPLAARPVGQGLVRAFLRTIRALRMADAAPKDVDALRDEAGRTHLLSRLATAYGESLASREAHDDATVFRTAIECVEAAGVPMVSFAILDETQVTGLSYRFVKAVAMDRLATIGRDGYGCPTPPNTAAVRLPRAYPPVQGRLEIGPGGRLLSGHHQAGEDNRLRLAEALDVEAEVRFVLREVLQKQIPLDAVEIAYTTRSPYLVRLSSELARLDLPATFAEGIPAHLTRPGQAITGFLKWIGSGLDSPGLVALCRANLLDLARPNTPWAGLQAYQAADVLLRVAPLARGRTAFEGAFERFRERRSSRNHLEGEDGDRGRADSELDGWVDAVEAAMRNLFDLVGPESGASLHTLAGAASAFVDRFAPVRDDRDALARNSLADRLKEIAAGWEGPGDRADLALRLVALLQDHTFEALSARPGQLHIVPLSRCGYTGREHVYVLGMDEGSFPGGSAEDPILLDREREHVSPEMDLLRTGPVARSWHLIRALGAATGRVTLITRRRSLADGREVYPSPVFQHAMQMPGIGRVEQAGLLPNAPEEGLDETEAVLALRSSNGYSESVAASYPRLAHGASAAAARTTAGFTRYDGLLGHPTPELDPVADVLSASGLETLTACPYKYFLRYVLRVEPLDEPEDDPSRWLAPLHIGGLLHDLFCRFMRRLSNLGEDPDVDRHTDMLDGMLREEVDLLRQTLPPPNEAAFRADLRRLARAAEVFLAAEGKLSDRERVGFEVSFGFGEKGGLNKPGPVHVRLSTDLSVSLRGRIDRVDRTRIGYEICDYKTGSAAAYQETDLLRNLQHLQWALYAYALEEILAEQGEQLRIGRSGYFFTGEREHGKRLVSTPPAREALASGVEPSIQMARAGCFLHVQRANQCTYCDYDRVCRTEAVLPSEVSASPGGEAHAPELEPLLRRWMDVR